MKKDKQKVKFFEKIEITDPEYAQKVYEKEERKFKIKLIFTGIALLGSIGGFLVINNTGKGFIYDCLGITWLLGILCALLAGSIKNIFKIIFTIGKFGYFLAVPFPLDIVCFVFGIGIGILLCFMLPVIPCVITLYESYQNKKSAKDYLALQHNVVNSDI